MDIIRTPFITLRCSDELEIFCWHSHCRVWEKLETTSIVQIYGTYIGGHWLVGRGIGHECNFGFGLGKAKISRTSAVSQRTFAVEGPLPFRDATSWDERRLGEAPFRRDWLASATYKKSQIFVNCFRVACSSWRVHRRILLWLTTTTGTSAMTSFLDLL